MPQDTAKDCRKCKAKEHKEAVVERHAWTYTASHCFRGKGVGTELFST